jgi:hypothetical protein
MVEEVKRKALIFLFLALVITALIGAGLPRLKFQPGMPLPSLENGQVVALPSEDAPPVGVSINFFFVILILTLMAGYLLIQVYRLIKGVNWKKLLSQSFLLLILLVILGIFLIVNLLPRSQEPIYENGSCARTIPTAPLGRASVLIWLVAIGLVGSAAIFGIWMIGSKRQSSTLWGWKRKARGHLAGQDFRNVILDITSG